MEVKCLVSSLVSRISGKEISSKESLMARIRKRDVDAIMDWMDSKKSQFYKIGWAYLQNHHDIEDVFQTTIIKIYDNIFQLRDERYFDSWVTTIFINECKRILKKRKRSLPVEDLIVIDDDSKRRTKLLLTDGLNSIDEIYREIIILKYLKGYSQEEISDILKIPLGTVKSRLYRGLKRLKNELTREVK